jgi:hypothetical protein
MTFPGDSGAPTFREPWQAKAFAMVVLLHRQGQVLQSGQLQRSARVYCHYKLRRAGVKDTRFHSHFSLLKTLEAAFGLGYLGHAADVTTNTLAPLLAPARED